MKWKEWCFFGGSFWPYGLHPIDHRSRVLHHKKCAPPCVQASWNRWVWAETSVRTCHHQFGTWECLRFETRRHIGDMVLMVHHAAVNTQAKSLKAAPNRGRMEVQRVVDSLRRCCCFICLSPKTIWRIPLSVSPAHCLAVKTHCLDVNVQAMWHLVGWQQLQSSRNKFTMWVFLRAQERLLVLLQEHANVGGHSNSLGGSVRYRTCNYSNTQRGGIVIVRRLYVTTLTTHRPIIWME